MANEDAQVSNDSRENPLGIILFMELVGMALGSVALGFFADKLGRRSVLLGCLVVMRCSHTPFQPA